MQSDWGLLNEAVSWTGGCLWFAALAVAAVLMGPVWWLPVIVMVFSVLIGTASDEKKPGGTSIYRTVSRLLSE